MTRTTAVEPGMRSTVNGSARAPKYVARKISARALKSFRFSGRAKPWPSSDENWREHQLRIDGVLSELLQHEIDHLDGVLAVSRAIDGASFALQSQRHLLAGAAFANEPRCQFFPAA
jgi:hypothetical protein